MSLASLSIRCTHTGLLADGRPNTGPVLIPDLDVGYENQLRKVPCYVPVGGSIDIPASSRALLSFDQGAIKKFSDAGVLTSSLFIQPDVYDNGTRPAAAAYPAGTAVWNTDDNALNWSDGAGNWRDGQGNIT